MATLANKAIKDTYTSLLKLEGDTQTVIAGASGNAIQVKTGDDNTTPVYLNTDRVGIGVDSPTTALHVKTASGNAEIYLEADGNDARFSMDTGANDKASYIYFRDAGDLNNAIVSFNENYGTASMQSSIGFYTDAQTDSFSATAPKLLIDADGKVGIGTNAPDQALEIAGAGTTVLHIDAGDDATLNLDVHADGDMANIVCSVNGEPNSSIKFIPNGTSTNTLLAFNVEGAERMWIKGDGNVGIGTDSPNVDLHIESTTTSSTLLDISSKNDGTNADVGVRFFHGASPVLKGSVGYNAQTEVIMITAGNNFDNSHLSID